MGAKYVLISIHFLATFLCTNAQFYGPNPSLYPFQPYQPYVSQQAVSNGPYPSLYQYPSVYPFYPNQQHQPVLSEQPVSNGQSPYDPSYQYQQYQPFVSNQPVSSGQSYIYPAQEFAPVSYPAQFYPQPAYTPYPYDANRSSIPPVSGGQNSTAFISNQFGLIGQGQGYAPVSNYPASFYPQPAYPYAYTANQSNATPPANNTNTSSQDPYANIKVEIIDVDLQKFPYYKRFFNLDDNPYPVNRPVARPVQIRSQPYYIVKSESKSSNVTNVPKGISMHDVKTKTYSFKKTFTVDPSKKESSVINLTFVNGVQVTDSPAAEAPHRDETTVAPVMTTEEIEVTTESEEPAGILTWL